jgi:purine-binding chemotaxis protein CheW
MARAKARSDSGAHRSLTIVVAGQQYCIPAEHVLEVGRRPVITRVPNSLPSLAGLMNFRGVATPVIRVSALVHQGDGSAPAPSSEARIVVYDERSAVALLVDDVQQLTAAQGASVPSLNIAELLTGKFVAATPTQSGDLRHRALPDLTIEKSVVERALLSFQVSGQYFAIPLENVSEVLKLPANPTGLPRSAATSLGMITLRDQLVPLVSLATLLGLAETAKERHHVVIVRFGGAQIGLVSDMMGGVVRVPETSIESVPAILQRGSGDAEIDAIARGDEHRPLISILTPSRLFRNREVRAALADQGVKETSMPETLSADPDQRFLVFAVGDDVFGLPIESVDEIVQLPDAISRVPNAPEFVAGVINVRGKAVPVIDQRMRFQAQEGLTAKRPRVIVVTMGKMQAGFIVDSVSEILSVPNSAIGSAPNLPGSGAQIFDRVASRGDDGAMILLVDPKGLLDKAERDLLKRFEPAASVALPS